MPTPKQMLLEHLYSGDLPADIAELRESGTSWRDIAAEVGRKTGQRVAYESLRTWYGGDEASAA